jgi:hypothetical protein
MKLKWTFIVAGILSLSSIVMAENKHSNPPYLAIPKLSTPPVIDGIINEKEWNNASLITGFTSYSVGTGSRWLPPNNMQSRWWLAWDKEHLYMAIRVPAPAGTLPKAESKVYDEMPGPAILWDDHLEIQISSHGRKIKNSARGGFYKIMSNARGTVMDQWFKNGVPASEELWTFGAKDNLKARVTKDGTWETEIAIPLKSIQVEKAAGAKLIVHLCLAGVGGGHDRYDSWVPTHWYDWMNFGELILDPDAPALQIDTLGEAGKGQFAPQISLRSQVKTRANLEFEVKDAASKILYDQKKELTLPADQVTTCKLPSAKVKLTSFNNDTLRNKLRELNSWNLKATYGSDNRPLAWLPIYFPLMDDVLDSRFVKPYVQYRASKSEWRIQFAYLPYYDRMRTAADLDYFGIDPQLLAKAKKAQFEVLSTGNSTPLAKSTADIKNKMAHTLLKLPNLSDGKYKLKVNLVDANGEKIATKEESFTRKHYPWEHNKLGTGKNVIPPYQNLKTIANRPNSIRTVSNNITFSPQGLPASDNLGILTKPISIYSIDAKGQPQTSKFKLTFPEQTDNQWKIQATGSLGNIACQIDSRFDFDGWQIVKITLDPGQHPATIQGLRLDAELFDRACFMDARNERGDNQWAVGLPDGKGLIWESRQAKIIHKPFKSFIPVLYVGDGDPKGLWFKAESPAGWELSDNVSAAELHRLNSGNILMRFNLISKPVELKSARTIEFALIMVPNKPEPVNYRRVSWGYPYETYFHDTSGWRYWGGSVDGYELHTDEDFSALRRHLMKLGAGGMNGDLGRPRSPYAPVVLYGSSKLMGLGMEEFDTFAGEWLGKQKIKLSPEARFKGKKNVGGSITWQTDRQLTVRDINFTQSQIDCFVWYHEQLIRRAGVNGFFWDNGDLGLIKDFNPATNSWETRYNCFQRRDLTQRLNRINAQNRRAPWWVINTHTTWEYAQVNWQSEGHWYDYMNTMPVTTMGANSRTMPGIFRRISSHFNSENIMRAIGINLLHDVGIFRDWHWKPFAPRVFQFLEMLDRKIDFFEDSTRFYGYWSKMISTSTGPLPEGVYVSAYVPSPTTESHPKITLKNRALLVVWNDKSEPIEIKDFTINTQKLLGRSKISRVTDLRTNTGLSISPKGNGFRLGWDRINPKDPAILPVAGRDFRLLLIE